MSENKTEMPSYFPVSKYNALERELSAAKSKREDLSSRLDKLVEIKEALQTQRGIDFSTLQKQNRELREFLTEMMRELKRLRAVMTEMSVMDKMEIERLLNLSHKFLREEVDSVPPTKLGTPLPSPEISSEKVGAMQPEEITDTQRIDWLQDVHDGKIEPPDEYPGQILLREAIDAAIASQKREGGK